jgi:predicted AlkP superfamily pyrophosphatase or phosphodiesterase
MFTAVARQKRPDQVTTAGIFGKPKLARLFATRRAVAAPGYDADHLWAPCESPSDDTPYCRPVPINPSTRYALTDGVVMDEVLRTVRDGVRADGAVKRPNLTFVNLPTIDSAGHATGAGAAYDAAIAMADGELRRFVDQQKALGLWGRTVLLTVSDHSMDTTAVKSSLRSRFALAGIPDRDYLIVQNGSLDMVYLTDRTRPDRDALLARLRMAALSDTLVGAVDEALYRLPNAFDGGTANTLDGRHPGWRLAGERTGDLVVTHRVGGAFSDPLNPLTGNHGGPETTDNLAAAIGGGPYVRQQALSGRVAPRFDDTLLNPGQAQNVDVAPTVLSLLGRTPPAASEGRVLSEAFDVKRLPRAPR